MGKRLFPRVYALAEAAWSEKRNYGSFRKCLPALVARAEKAGLSCTEESWWDPRGKARREEADQAAEKEEYYYARFRFCKDNNSILYPREGYDGSIEAYLTYVREHDDGRRTCYALWDIDSDGEEEVFLGKEDGDLIEMLKMEDGVVSIRFCDFVCQGNVLEDYFTYGFYPNGETTTRREGSGHVYKDIDGTVLSRLLYDDETGTWRQDSKYWDTATDISEEKAQAIIAKYPRIDLKMEPISRYPSE